VCKPFDPAKNDGLELGSKRVQTLRREERIAVPQLPIDERLDITVSKIVSKPDYADFGFLLGW